MDFNVGSPRRTRRAALGALFSAAGLGLIALMATKTDYSNNAMTVHVSNLRRKLVGESLPFAHVERELPLTIPGVPAEDTWSTVDARQLVQETRSDMNVQETNERKLLGESLPSMFVERELPLTIPGVTIEDTWQ